MESPNGKKNFLKKWENFSFTKVFKHTDEILLLNSNWVTLIKKVTLKFFISSNVPVSTFSMVLLCFCMSCKQRYDCIYSRLSLKLFVKWTVLECRNYVSFQANGRFFTIHYKKDNVSLQRKVQTGFLPIIKDLGFLSLEVISHYLPHCMCRMKKQCLLHSGVVNENAHTLLAAITVSNKLLLSLIQESCVICQHPWNWQPNLLAGKWGKILDPSQLLTGPCHDSMLIWVTSVFIRTFNHIFWNEVLFNVKL